MLNVLYGDKPSVAWAAAGSLPVGYHRVEQLAELPSAPGRSFLVSLAPRRGAASVLTSYNALRSGRKRVARRALGVALLTGLAAPLLRTRIDIGVRSAASPEQQACDLLTEQLRKMCSAPRASEPRLAVAISGGGGPYRKPVLQVFSGTGRPLGFVKVGWNEWTRIGVQREAAALRACAAHPPKFGVPKLLDSSDWHGLDLLATAPLPDKVHGIGAATPLPGATVLREISELSAGGAGPLAGSTWWQGVRSRIRCGGMDSSARHALERLASRLEAGYGDVRFTYGFCHGDFVPWNMARVGGRLYLWDWENSIPDGPLGFDAVHYYFRVAFVGQGRPLAEAAEIAARSARAALLELGVPVVNCGLLAVLHLTEMFLQHEEARSATGIIDERFYPAVNSVLEHRLAHVQQMAPDVFEGVS